MNDYQSLLANASELPVGQRVQLIDALWDTLPENAMPPLSDEWLAEIKRRSAEYDAGTVEPISWEQVRADAMRRINGAE
jgi:putative addiction module component (TIGR02574 family)